jgi:glycosyltransferase involved in cell wall biosynthesis
MERFVEETLASVQAQTYSSIETIIVNDGSLREEDRVVYGLAERYGAKLVVQPNSGLGSARNFGVVLARGRYVLPVDPDDVLLPSFVERCVRVLEARPELGYVTAWSDFIDEDGHALVAGYRPLGNTVADLRAENLAGSAMCVIRRRLFERGVRYSRDLTSFEDWLLFSELRRAGIQGHVIPEHLLRYRVRRASMLRGVGHARRARLYGELEAHRREAEVEWMSSSA